jgi:predicted kinase
MTLYIFRGLMGSGKSTKAREMQSELGGRIVERDAIRFMLYGKYTGVDEKVVTEVQNTLLEQGLRFGDNVFVSDMNLKNAYVVRLIEKAQLHNQPWEIVDMTDVPLSVCLDQNRSPGRLLQGKIVDEARVVETYDRFIRGRQYPMPVLFTGAKMPKRRFEAYARDTSLPTAVMWDVDGTLLHMKDRGPFDEHLVLNDYADPAVREMYRAAKALGHHMIVMSGRTDGCWDDTKTSLQREIDPHFDPRDERSRTHLIMRRTVEDRGRPDDDVKYDLFTSQVAPRFNVLYVVDDRDKVVKMWREIGLTCAQVAYGDF